MSWQKGRATFHFTKLATMEEEDANNNKAVCGNRAGQYALKLSKKKKKEKKYVLSSLKYFKKCQQWKRRMLIIIKLCVATEQDNMPLSCPKKRKKKRNMCSAL